jgi:hypothetical protein
VNPVTDCDFKSVVTEYFNQLPRSYRFHGYTTLIDLALVDRRALEDFRQASLYPDLLRISDVPLLDSALRGVSGMKGSCCGVHDAGSSKGVL